jgi:hypothetical protein
MCKLVGCSRLPVRTCLCGVARIAFRVKSGQASVDSSYSSCPLGIVLLLQLPSATRTFFQLGANAGCVIMRASRVYALLPNCRLLEQSLCTPDVLGTTSQEEGWGEPGAAMGRGGASREAAAAAGARGGDGDGGGGGEGGEATAAAVGPNHHSPHGLIPAAF